jgi:hypothetical protein
VSGKSVSEANPSSVDDRPSITSCVLGGASGDDEAISLKKESMGLVLEVLAFFFDAEALAGFVADELVPLLTEFDCLELLLRRASDGRFLLDSDGLAPRIEKAFRGDVTGDDD